MQSIPNDYADLLTGTHVAHVGTILPDGRPHQAPVWVDYDGEYLYVGGKADARKMKNVDGNPNVSISVTDSENPYRFVIVRGTVIERTTDDALEFIDRLSDRYWGCPYPNDRDADRRKLTIEPDHVVARTIDRPDR